MESIELSRRDRTTWLLVFVGFIVMTARALYKIEHWGYPEILLVIGMVFYISLLTYIISDILKKNNKYKVLLIISMFLLPAIAPIAYMIKYYYSSK